MFDLHSSAIENFDKKAEALVDLVKECKNEESRGASPSSDVHIKAAIGEEEILGDIEEKTTNHKKRS